MEILAQIKIFLLGVAADSVEIDMIDRHAAVIFIDQRERRAANPSVIWDAQTLRNTAHEASLTSP